MVSINNWLVVLTILKNLKVNGKDYSIYYGTFETTNKNKHMHHDVMI